MSKTYTGIELLEAIKNKEIKENTNFIDEYNCNYIYKLDGIEGDLTLYRQEQYHEDSIPDYSVFVDNIFTVVENDNIDIQSIEESKWMTATDRNIMINKLIKAVKQIDRQINNK